MKRLTSYPMPHRNQGFSLVVGLILLLAMTLIGVTASRVARTELLLANNAQNAAEAFAAAENSTLVGERDIVTNYSGIPTFNFSADNTDGYYSAGEVGAINTDWSTLPHETGAAAEDVEYVVEYLGPAPGSGSSLALGVGTFTQKRYIFRVSGRGDSSKGSVRLVQTVFATTE